MDGAIKKLWESLRAPLELCSRDSFARLAKIKNIEEATAARAQRLISALEAAGFTKVSPEVSQIVDSLHGFEAMPIAQKRTVVTNALAVMTELEGKCRLSAEPYLPSEKPTPAGVVMQQSLATPVQFLKGVGPRFAALLTKKGIDTVEDILYFLPRCYEDRRRIYGVADVPLGVRASVVGKILSASFVIKRRKRAFEALIGDHRQQLRASWFNGNFSHLAKNFQQGRFVLFTGEVRLFGYIKTMVHPDWELLDDEEGLEKGSVHWGRIIPIYSETEGLSSKTLRRIIQSALEIHAGFLSEDLPADVTRKRKLMPLAQAIENVHFPADEANLSALNEARSEYHRRIIYEEFFFLQLGMGLKRSSQMLEEGIAFKVDKAPLEKFYKSLPFSLTQAQQRVIAEIAADMQKTVAMYRLLQGDVGSGKTLVAFAAMLIACGNGYQAILMAPTELLAQQHFATLQARAEAFGFSSVLLVGSLTASQKQARLAAIASGEAQIIIGTHALFYEQVSFARVGLVVIDEQHRFGVAQRGAIRKKGFNPDVLVMSATPIPRTLAMSVYGDLDVSVIDELPSCRKPVKTKLYFESQRTQVYDFIKAELMKGSQVFIIYPLIEESDTLALKDASRMAHHLQSEVFPNFVVGLVHGRLKAREREEIMESFQNGAIQILVATTVVEVGIDIPEASVMVIENAERFGLSQLHQLRGRVGRGNVQSYCLLLAQHTGSSDARRRLKIMEETNDGFKIAEEDLLIRGPGDFLGARQSGLPVLRVGNIVRDVALLAQAREDAQELLRVDARLEHIEHRRLRQTLQKRWQGRLGFARIG